VHGTGAPDRELRAVNLDLVASRWIGVTGHVRHSASHKFPGFTDGGTLALVCQEGKGNVALTPPPVAPSLGRSFQTTSLAIDPPLMVRLVPPQSQGIGTRRGEVYMIQTVGDPVRRAVVSTSDAHGHADRRCRLQRGVIALQRLRCPS